MDKAFSEWLIAKNWEPEDLEGEQLVVLQAAYNAEKGIKPAPVAGGEDFATRLEAQKAENARVEKIQQLTILAIERNPAQVEALQKMAAHAIEAKYTSQTFELELLRAERPQVGSIFRPRTVEKVNGSVIEAALCRTGKLANIEKHYNEQTLDASDRLYRHGIGLQELLILAAQENRPGERFSIHGDLRTLLKAAFADVHASGFSTLSVSGILSNVANKFLIDAFNAVESAWRAITAIRPVRDFKQITSYSLTGDLTYEKVGAGGEIPHGTLGEESYTNKAETYGKMLAITRRDIVNDDLGAFIAVPRRLGRGGALKINSVFWTEFTDNSDFFKSDNANYDDGADTAFGADALTAMDILFRAQTDPDGNPLGSMPKILLVPPTHRIPALRLMNSQLTAEDSDAGSSNPWAGAFQVVSSQYLSGLAYYLLADPQDIPVIETCFLNGSETPTVESADADFNTLGIQIRGYHDFGVAKQEYRGGVKYLGASA